MCGNAAPGSQTAAVRSERQWTASSSAADQGPRMDSHPDRSLLPLLYAPSDHARVHWRKGLGRAGCVGGAGRHCAEHHIQTDRTKRARGSNVPDLCTISAMAEYTSPSISHRPRCACVGCASAWSRGEEKRRPPDRRRSAFHDARDGNRMPAARAASSRGFTSDSRRFRPLHTGRGRIWTRPALSRRAAN